MRKILACMLCLMALGSGLAETEGEIRCWTSNPDGYYHLRKSCSGAEVYPISESAAQAFGKKPCPECVEEENTDVIRESFGIRAAERGGTCIISIPEAAVDSIPVDGEPVASKAFSGAAAEDELMRLMSARACEEFNARFDADGWASDRCRMPEILWGKDDLYMSSRLIDGVWQIAIRPEKGCGDETEIRWRAVEYDILRDEPEVVETAKTLSDAYSETVRVEDHSGAETMLERDYGNLSLTVYRQNGMNTAVFRDEREGGKSAATLSIGGSVIAANLNGYKDAQKRGTYCCVISDAELGAIVAGQVPALEF